MDVVPDLSGHGAGGWVDFDPTNDRLPINRHVTVAWGRDYGDVAPVRGVVIGPNAVQTLSVAVDVDARAGATIAACVAAIATIVSAARMSILGRIPFPP